MLERAVVVSLVIAGALAASRLVRLRRSDPPTQPRWSVPSQIDRSDFPGPEVAWTVVVFTSTTCDACAGTVVKTLALASDQVVVSEIELSAAPELHHRYDIDAVPTLVIADQQGVVKASFVGPPPASDLWAAMAALREMDGD